VENKEKTNQKRKTKDYVPSSLDHVEACVEKKRLKIKETADDDIKSQIEVCNQLELQLVQDRRIRLMSQLKHI